MSKTQIFVQQADGTAREVEIVSSGVVLLNPNEHLFIAASSDQAQVEAGAPGEVTIKLEGIGEFTVESAEDVPEAIAMVPEVSVFRAPPTIVFETVATELTDNALTHEALAVHQARVDSTAFLDRQVGEDFGMSQLLDMAAFSAMSGDDFAERNAEEESDRSPFRELELVNNAPTSNPVTLPAIDEDTSTTITVGQLLSGALDVDGDPLSVSDLALNDPTAGTLVTNIDGTWTFTPDPDWNGDVTFSYRISDGELSTPGTAYLTVNPVNDAPTSDPVTLSAIDEDTSIIITVGQLLSGALDVDGDPLSVSDLKLNDPTVGTLVANIDGTWTFTPNPDWNGDVTFSYRISDGELSTPGTAYLSVNPVDDAPTSDPVTLESIDEDTSTTITVGQLLSGALDVDGDPLSVSDLALNDPTAGDLVANIDGTWTFTPNPDWNGDVTFSYQVSDGELSTPGTAYLSVNPVDDVSETIRNNTLIVNDEEEALLNQDSLLTTDVDTTPSALTYSISKLLYGELLKDGTPITDFVHAFTQQDLDDNRLTYKLTPTARVDTAVAFSDESFSFTVSDGVNTTAAQAFNIHNTVAQVWGTNNADDLITGFDFTDTSTRFYVYGFEGDDTLCGGRNGDTLHGDEGSDTADYHESRDGVHVDLTLQDGTQTQSGGDAEGDVLTGIENVTGSNGADALIGDGNANVLHGLGGDDTITGNGGNDSVYGGAGHDAMVGNYAGRTLMDGGVGNDTITGNGENDTIYGGEGEDEIWIYSSSSQTFVDAGDNDDRVTSFGNDTVHGGAGNDTLSSGLVKDPLARGGGPSSLSGGEGDDWFFSLTCRSGQDVDDTMDGGDGIDTVEYRWSYAGVEVDLTNTTDPQGGKNTTSYAYGDVLRNIENVIGSNYFGDRIIGDSKANALSGLGGNDTITAGAGDTVYGGTGSDVLFSSDAALDLASSTVIEGVERVDLMGSAASLTVNGDAIWNNASYFSSKDDEELVRALIVNGDVGDVVHISSDSWTWNVITINQELDDGKAYIVYEGNKGGVRVHLYVENHMFVYSDDNDAPMSDPVTLEAIDEDTSIFITVDQLLSEAVDVDGDPLSVSDLALNDPTAGDLVANIDGTWTFTPDSDWNGDVTFSYRISDGELSTPGTAYLSVNPVVDAPTSDPVTLPTIDEDYSTTITAEQLLSEDLDVDGDPLSVRDLALNDPTAGDLVANVDGFWTFTPDPDWNGDVTFSYQVSDGELSTPGTAYLTVNPVNDAPVIDTNSPLAVDEGEKQALAGSLLTLDVDNPSEELMYSIGERDEALPGDGARKGLPRYGELLLGDDPITDFDRAFTQKDIDEGRVFFRFHAPQPGDESQVIEDDSFVFTVTDGDKFMGPATFHLHNTTVQVLGTGTDDDLTGVTNFDRADAKYLVYGFGGDEILRGGVNGDTLDGGDGNDTADYSRSSAAVHVDLNLHGTVAQSGGEAGNHAAGDALISIENVIGTNDTLDGDVLTGNNQANQLSGLAGNDTLDGGEGNDTADYSRSSAAVHVDLNLQGTVAQSGGEAGNHAAGDVLISIENVIGSNRADVLIGDGNANMLSGLDGDDTISGGAGNDTLVGGVGVDSLDGGTGIDMADYSASDTWVNVDLSLRTAPQSGGGVNNHAEDDILVGIEGVTGSNDSLNGDVLTGNEGNNQLIGLAGNDTLDGGDGNDTLYGGDGNDALYGGSGRNTIWGGEGDDYLDSYSSGDGMDDGDGLIGGAGNDTLDGSHSTGSSKLVGGIGADCLIGNGISTWASYEITGHRDVPEFNPNTVYVDLNIQGGKAQSGGPEGNDAIGDILTGIVNVGGSWGRDTIIGNDQDNVLSGVDGDDFLVGGVGNDTLTGDNDNDTLEGGAGADIIEGGAGYDIASYRNAGAGVNVSLEIQLGGLQVGKDGDEQKGDALWHMDGLWGSDHDDTLTGSNIDDPGNTSVHNFLNGYEGDDLLSGLAGDDTLDGGADNDTLIGGAGNDVLLGGEGNDLLQAGASDTVGGGAGIDVLLCEDAHLDVASSTTMTGIERVDLSGVGESLRVTGDAIVSNGVLDPLGDGAYALIVTGDAGDLVYLRGDTWNWTLAGQGADIGDGSTYAVYEAARASGTVRLYIQNGLAVDSGVNDAPIVFVNDTLLVDNTTAQSLAGSLLATDTDNNAASLRYSVTQAPVQGALFRDGVMIRNFSQPVFTQEDIDNGRVSFRFHAPEAGDEIRVFDTDSFVFRVSDGKVSSVEATFVLRNTVAQVLGTHGSDSLVGAAHFDAAGARFYGFGGDDTLRGGSGADTLDGGVGIDMADYHASATWVNVNLNLQEGIAAIQSGGGANNHAEDDILVGIEGVIGTNDTLNGDVLTGNNQANLLSGLGGDDTLSGGAGNDTLVGGVGADSLDGGLNSDMADYSASSTWVNVDLNLQNDAATQSGGGANNHAEDDILVGIEGVTGSNDMTHGDVLIGDDESNWLSGGDGNDTLNGGSGVDTLWGGDGDDSLQAGLSLVYVVDGYADLLLGGAGNDTLDGTLSVRSSMLCGGTGADRIIGNGRDSQVNYQYTGHRDVFDDNYNAVYVDLNIQDGNAQRGGPAGNDAIGDILSGIVNVVGSWGDDTLIGNRQNNFLSGNDGDDVLEGGAGADRIYGGKGYDIASYHHADAGVNVSLKIQDGGLQDGNDGDEQKGDELFYIDGLWGSDHADTLTGTDHGYTGFASEHNVLNGYGGDDLLSGLAGDDTLDGGADNDTLIGGSGNDLLLGGEDDDLLIGGMTDTADGGDGFDTFRLEYNTGTGGAFDLSAMSDAGRITGIEGIDISGDADDVNALTLRAGDVFKVSGGALYVDGDANDSVTTIGTDWTHQADDVTHNGQTYHHYTSVYDSQTVNLYVDIDVTYQTQS